MSGNDLNYVGQLIVMIFQSQTTRGTVPKEFRTFRRLDASGIGEFERVGGSDESDGQSHGVTVRGGGHTFPGGGIAQETVTGGKGSINGSLII